MDYCDKSMSAEKSELKTKGNGIIADIMRSNALLLVKSWCYMWGILGVIFTIIWLMRYFA